LTFISILIVIISSGDKYRFFSTIILKYYECDIVYCMITSVYGNERVDSYVGAVLALREENYYDDSDFYVIVWNGSELEKVYYDTTRFPTTSYAVVDATPEVIALAEKDLEEKMFRILLEEEKKDAEEVDLDKRVEVIKGKKVPIGTTGVVTKIWTRRFGTSGPVTCVRLLTDAGEEVLTYAKNLKVLEPEKYMRSIEEIRAHARRIAKAHVWHAPFVKRGMVVV